MVVVKVGRRRPRWQGPAETEGGTVVVIVVVKTGIGYQTTGFVFFRDYYIMCWAIFQSDRVHSMPAGPSCASLIASDAW